MRIASGTTDGSGVPGWLFLLLLGGIPIIILSFVAVLFDMSSRSGSARSPYAALIHGSIPTVQHVGRRVTLRFSVLNTGAPIPQLVILFTGLDAWDVTRAYAINGDEGSSIDTLGNGEAWQFGKVRRHRVLKIVIEGHPVRAGRPSVTLRAFAGIDSSGSPDPTLELKGDGETWPSMSITR